MNNIVHQRLVIHHPNLLRNDEYIDCYQEIHHDFTVELPNNVLKKKILRN